jgi:hypothetical protein
MTEHDLLASIVERDRIIADAVNRLAREIDGAVADYMTAKHEERRLLDEEAVAAERAERASIDARYAVLCTNKCLRVVNTKTAKVGELVTAASTIITAVNEYIESPDGAVSAATLDTLRNIMANMQAAVQKIAAITARATLN